MRSFSHWTPRYVVDRFALMNFERAHPDLPWLTRTMIEILETWLRPSDIGLEFGSGRSTVWFAKRVAHLTSVEHHPDWYAKVKQKLDDHREIIRTIDYRLCEDGANDHENSEYVNVAKQTQLNSLDFVLVDGTARDYCALASLDKLKPGGILIIDNVNWYIPRTQKSHAPNSRQGDDYATETWRAVGRAIADWRCVWTTNGVTDTAFWVKRVE